MSDILLSKKIYFQELKNKTNHPLNKLKIVNIKVKISIKKKSYH